MSAFWQSAHKIPKKFNNQLLRASTSSFQQPQSMSERTSLGKKKKRASLGKDKKNNKKNKKERKKKE